METPIANDSVVADLARRSIRELIEANPEVMAVLAPLGIDLCCGGAHPLGEALALPGLDRKEVMPLVVEAMAGRAQRRG